MASYKDILNTFGGDTSYADRFQAAALKGDSAGMSSLIKEYKASQGGTAGSTSTYTPTTTYTPTYNQPTTTYTPSTPTTEGTSYTYSTPTYNQGNGNLGSWNYGDTSPDRQDEIVSNLNEAYAQNPNQFSDWATFAQNFNYDYSGRSDKERETMFNWYQQNVGNQMDYNNANNTDYFLAQLMGGGTLQGTGAAVTAAMNRYRNLQSLSAMTPDQIVSAIQSGALSGVGQEMQDLKNYSPALYAQVQTAMQNQTAVGDINSMGMGIYDGLTKTTSNSNYTKYNFTDEYKKNASVIKQYNESLYKKIEGLGGDTAAYVSIVASMLQNPLIQANKDEIENIEGEIRKIQENIYTVGDTARERLGSEAPEDLVSAYISQQTKNLQNQLRTAQNSLLVAQGKLDNQLSEVETLIDAINEGIELEGGIGGTGSSDYQYVSGTKYQQAGYFNKKTGEFIPLSGISRGTSGGTSGGTGGIGGGGYVDTNNYQDDSQARLQQIASNLESLYKTNPELFSDRGTFNDYFKYNQRSAKQKQILESYWAKYGNKFSLGGGTSTGTGTTTTSNDKWQNLKQGIIAGDIAGSYNKGNVTRYGFKDSLNEEEVAVKMGQICAASEYDSLYDALGASARTKFKDEVKRRITSTVKNNGSKIGTRMKDAGRKGRKDEAKKLAKELGINFGTLGEEAIMSYYNSL